MVDLVGGAASRLYLPRAPATIPTQPIPISAGATAIGGTKLPSGEFILSSVNLLPRTGNYNDVVVFVLHTGHDWKRPARSRLLLPERMRHKVSLLLLSSIWAISLTPCFVHSGTQGPACAPGGNNGQNTVRCQPGVACNPWCDTFAGGCQAVATPLNYPFG